VNNLLSEAISGECEINYDIYFTERTDAFNGSLKISGYIASALRNGNQINSSMSTIPSSVCWCCKQKKMKKVLRERRKHCALAVVRRSQKFSPRHIPLPGGAGRPKFNQLEMVTTFTYKPSLVRIDARNFELS